MPDVAPPWQDLSAVAVIGNYVPRRCGIATFTADLTEAVAAAAPDLQTLAVAMNDQPEGYRYPPRVWFEINQNRLAEYRLAADYLNMSDVDVCCIQHEFGIYGGREGQHVLELLKRLRMPSVVTLHTVLKEPDETKVDVLRQMARYTDRFVVMAQKAVDFLTGPAYDLDPGQVTLIPHGIPDVPFVDPNFYKDQFGVEGKRVILTFGLLGPGKGIENMIEALPRVLDRHADTVYIVLGATHPGVLAHQGEEYRLNLQRRAKELGINKSILWVNKFVDATELVEYLGSADVYVTPYHNEAQITSGTLAYAVGTGKAVVSTPYWHAQELLADGRGRIVPMKDNDALGDAILDLFDNEVERHATRKRAYQYSRPMRWSEIGKRYLELFADVRESRHAHPRPAVPRQNLTAKTPELAPIRIDHLRTLTDDTGIFAHALFTTPDRDAGYTTDDNARALIAALLAQDHLDYTQGARLDELINRYLAFVVHAFDENKRTFRTRLKFNRHWADNPDASVSEDTHGRAMWALGETVARSPHRGHVTLAAGLFHQALPACEEFEHPMGLAYSLIAIHTYLRRFSGDSNARRVREHLGERLFDMFQKGGEDWPWPTDAVTYKAARLPQALLLCGRWMFRDDMTQLALRSLEWLAAQTTNEAGQFEPIGTGGYLPRGGEKSRFDQLPGQAVAAIDAYLEAYRITDDHQWLTRAHRCLDWFQGDNVLSLPLYDTASGGCADALQPHGLSENQGAEATLAWLLALLAMYDHALDPAVASGTGTEPVAKINPAAAAPANANAAPRAEPAKPAPAREPAVSGV